MNPVQAVQSALGNYANFNGRSRRSEYWWFFLIVNISFLVLGILGALVLSLLQVVEVVLALAVTVRRLHDTGRSGWWILLGLVPFGGLVLLVFFVLPGTSGPNQYGEEPQ